MSTALRQAAAVAGLNVALLALLNICHAQPLPEGARARLDVSIALDQQMQDKARTCSQAIERRQLYGPELPPFQVMGLTQAEVLHLIDDEHGAACNHIRGGLANRWCHAAVVKTISASLQHNGMPHMLAHALASLSFFVKEYGMDLNPSVSDIALTGDLPIRLSTNTQLKVSTFADKRLFAVLVFGLE